jgi:ubiquitin carboxyl-terminal hydrolase 36/42
MARKIQFRDMRAPDRAYEQLRLKYRPINSQTKVSSHRDATAAAAPSYTKQQKQNERPEQGDHDADGELEDTEELRGQVELFSRSALSLKWQRVYKIGSGLDNIGNTCFLNSVLQCLLYTPALANYLLTRQHKSACRVQAGFCALCELQDLAVECVVKSNGNRSVLPRAFIRGLKGTIFEEALNLL